MLNKFEKDNVAHQNSRIAFLKNEKPEIMLKCKEEMG